MSWRRALLRALLHLLDQLEHRCVQRVISLQSGELGRGIRRGRPLEDLGQLSTLIVTGNVLESESHLNRTQQGVKFLTTLCQLRGRSDETLHARQLTHGSTADTLDLVLEVRVGNTANNRVDVILLLLLRDAMLGDNQSSSLVENIVDDTTNVLIRKRIRNHLLAVVVSVVSDGCVTRVDGVELAFDVGLEVVHPVNSGDVRVADRAKGFLFDDPLVELFDADIETAVSRLVGNNTVNSGISELSTFIERLQTRVIGVFFDEAVQCIGSTNGVLASNHSHRLGGGTSINTLGNDGSDELENVRADSAGDNVGRGNLLDNITLVGLGIDGTVVGDGLGFFTLLADFGDLVGVGFLEGGDDVVRHIDEDDLVTGLVEELGHEATANVTTAELDGLLSHCVRRWCQVRRWSRFGSRVDENKELQESESKTDIR